MFRGAEKQMALRIEGIMKDGKHLFLKIGLHVNQQVPAGNDIHSRKGGIADEVMKGKNAQIAYNLGHPIEGTVLFKKRRQPVG
jgi:hypothetical protein